MRPRSCTSLTLGRISQFQGSIKRAGSPVGNLTGGSVTYSNNLEKIETNRFRNVRGDLGAREVADLDGAAYGAFRVGFPGMVYPEGDVDLGPRRALDPCPVAFRRE